MIETIRIFKQVNGEFKTEKDGRLSGHVITITSLRKDKKYNVTHAYGNGKRFKKIYTGDQLAFEIEKLEKLANYYNEPSETPTKYDFQG
jgi:hypothetical protein